MISNQRNKVYWINPCRVRFSCNWRRPLISGLLTGGTSKASAWLKRIQNLNKGLDKVLQARRALAPLNQEDVFDESSLFWTEGPMSFWQSLLQEKTLLIKDLRMIYTHAQQDTEALSTFLESEIRDGLRT